MKDKKRTAQKYQDLLQVCFISLPLSAKRRVNRSGFINLRSKGDQVAEVPLGGRVVAQSERRSRTVDSQFFSPIINSNISQKVIASDWGRGRSDPSTRYKISAFKRGVRRVPINLRSVVLFFFFASLFLWLERGKK